MAMNKKILGMFKNKNPRNLTPREKMSQGLNPYGSYTRSSSGYSSPSYSGSTDSGSGGGSSFPMNLLGGSTMNSLLSLAGNLAPGLLKNLSGMLNGKFDANKLIGQASSALQGVIGNMGGQLSGMLQSVMSSPGSILGGSADNFAKSFKQMEGMFTKPSELIATITPISGDKGPKEAQDKEKKLGADSSESLSTAVAWVTKPMNNMIKGVGSSKQGSSPLDMFKGLGGGALGNISKFIGSAISSPQQLNGAIGKITSSLVSNFSDAPKMSSSIFSPSSSSPTSFFGGLVGGISSSLGLTSTNNNLYGSSYGKSNNNGSIFSLASNALSSVIGGLPSPIKNLVNSVGGNFLATTAANLLGNKMSELNFLTKALGGTGIDSQYAYNSYIDVNGGSSSGYNRSVDYGRSFKTSNKQYPSFYDSINNRSYPNNTNSSSVKGLQDLVKKVFLSNQPQQKVYEYGNNKAVYDTTLHMAADMGAVDVILDLIGLGSKNTSSGYARPALYDDRSKNTLKKNATNAAKRGDVYTYSVIVDALGPSNISNAEQDMITLAANLEANDEFINMYNQLLKKFNLNTNKLTSGTYIGKKKIINGQRTAVMTAASNRIIDDDLTSRFRKLVIGAIYAFS